MISRQQKEEMRHPITPVTVWEQHAHTEGADSDRGRHDDQRRKHLIVVSADMQIAHGELMLK